VIVCVRCGAHNADGERFCSSCQSFLEWDGEAVPEAVPTAPVLPVEAPALPVRRPGWLARLRSALGRD